jgi:pyruvate/2-oxoglutarate dehydrogenase complex dihydrolipoamide acyltransferase (E2) component
MTDVRIPEDLWDPEKTAEGVVSNWFYDDGAEVPEGATLAEIAVEKSTYEITAPAKGRLHIEVPKDGVVQPGTVIARINGG